MRRAIKNPAVTRVRSWAEEVRAEETERALNKLQTLEVKDKEVVVSLSRRLVGELLAGPTAFATHTSGTLPNSKRLPILCGMFERQGPACDGCHCLATDLLGTGVPFGDGCDGVAFDADYQRERTS